MTASMMTLVMTLLHKFVVHSLFRVMNHQLKLNWSDPLEERVLPQPMQIARDTMFRCYVVIHAKNGFMKIVIT